MQILSTYRNVLLESAEVSSLVDGRVFIDSVGENEKKPSILLEMPEQGQDYSHDGPVGLMDAHLVVTCRAVNAGGAAELGEAVFELLQVWKGIERGCKVALTRHFKTSSKFEKGTEIFTHISEYTSFFSKE